MKMTGRVNILMLLNAYSLNVYINGTFTLIFLFSQFQNIDMWVPTILTCSAAEVTQYLPWWVCKTLDISYLAILK